MKTVERMKFIHRSGADLESRQMHVLAGGGYGVVCVGCMKGCSSNDDDVKVAQLMEMEESEGSTA